MVFHLGVLGLFKSRSRLANAKIGSHCRARCDKLFKCELGWHFSCNHGFHAFFAICDFNAKWQPHAKTHGPCQRVQGHQIWISSHFLIHTKKLSTLMSSSTILSPTIVCHHRPSMIIVNRPLSIIIDCHRHHEYFFF